MLRRRSCEGILQRLSCAAALVAGEGHGQLEAEVGRDLRHDLALDLRAQGALGEEARGSRKWAVNESARGGEPEREGQVANARGALNESARGS